MEFKIEKGIPIPLNWRGRVGSNMYPYMLMEVGDSFFIPSVDGKKVHISGAYKVWAKKSGFRFSSRRVDNGIRVWRIA